MKIVLNNKQLPPTFIFLRNLSQNGSYWPGLAIVVLFYILLYSWFLWFTDFVPYVIDNNESFSSLIHAFNLYHGDLSKSFGLTEEIFNPSINAHPMIHTHQGNWPRIFSLFIYILGARSIESQIVVTTFTIGLLSLWFSYSYFARVAPTYFAILACIIMFSDYLFFMQWQVNTYRVWHVFFIFSSLLCVHGLESSKKMWVGLGLLNYACLFYGELVFAGFVSLWTGLYAVALYFRYPKKIILVAMCGLGGFIIGLGILIVQLTAFMGFDNVIKDFTLIFAARNFATDVAMHSKILSNFYDNFNIAFFYNIQDGFQHRTIINFLRSFFQYGFQTYSPIFSLIILILSFMWLYNITYSHRQKLKTIFSIHIKYFWKFCIVSFFILSILGWKYGMLYLGAAAFMLIIGTMSFLLSISDLYYLNYKRAIGFLILPMYLFLLTFTYDSSLMGLRPALHAYSAIFSLVILSIVAFALSFFVIISSNFYSFSDRISSPKLFAVILVLLFLSAGIKVQYVLYDQSLKEVWFNALTSFYPLFVWKFIVIFSVCLSSIFILTEKEDLFGRTARSRLSFVMYFLLCGFLAYTVIYILSPGYLFSGYLSRFVPFHAFLINVIISVALYTLVITGWQFTQILFVHWPTRIFFLRRWKYVRAYPLMFSKMIAYLCLGTFTILILQWGFIQNQYFRLLPPTVFSFIKLLRKPDFQGKTSVSNTYALPMAIQMNSWSYNDPSIASGRLKFSEEGYSFPHDLRYLWFADRKTNTDYLHPNLFICFVPQDLHIALFRYQHPGKQLEMCSKYHLVRQALSLEANRLGHKMIARDKSGNDMWAIVGISEDFPPYLVENGNSKKIKIFSYGGKDDLAIKVKYKYKQQNNVKEDDSLVQLYRISRTKYSCSLYPEDIMRVNAHEGNAELKMPKGEERGEFVVVITPKSQRKVGDKWLSDVIDLSDGQVNVGVPCHRWRGRDFIYSAEY